MCLPVTWSGTELTLAGPLLASVGGLLAGLSRCRLPDAEHCEQCWLARLNRFQAVRVSPSVTREARPPLTAAHELNTAHSALHGWPSSSPPSSCHGFVLDYA